MTTLTVTAKRLAWRERKRAQREQARREKLYAQMVAEAALKREAIVPLLVELDGVDLSGAVRDVQVNHELVDTTLAGHMWRQFGAGLVKVQLTLLSDHDVSDRLLFLAYSQEPHALLITRAGEVLYDAKVCVVHVTSTTRSSELTEITMSLTEVR